MARLRRIAAGVLVIPAVFLVYGCMTGGAELPEESPLYGAVDEDGVPVGPGERNCEETSVDSPTNMACHADCVRNCGFNGTPKYPRAQKYCVCQSGVYIECRCPRPDWYVGDTFAPYCDSLTPNGSGVIGDLRNRRCEREFDQCVGRDPVDGFTPRGCVCLDPDNNGNLTWECGSTEKWFAPEQ